MFAVLQTDGQGLQRVCIGVAPKSGDLGKKAERRRRWGDGLEVLGHQSKGETSRIHCASRNLDSSERDVAGWGDDDVGLCRRAVIGECLRLRER